MAIATLHASILKDTEIYEVFYNYFTQIQIIEKRNDTIVFRVQGAGIPRDNTHIALVLYKFEGVRPFVIDVKTFA